jgi:hypothetical protein
MGEYVLFPSRECLRRWPVPSLPFPGSLILPSKAFTGLRRFPVLAGFLSKVINVHIQVN